LPAPRGALGEQVADFERLDVGAGSVDALLFWALRGGRPFGAMLFCDGSSVCL
jgi:hypothetical protein